MYATMTARTMARLLVEKHGFAHAVQKAHTRRMRYNEMTERAAHVANAPERRALRFKYSERAVWWKCIESVIVGVYGGNAR